MHATHGTSNRAPLALVLTALLLLAQVACVPRTPVPPAAGPGAPPAANLDALDVDTAYTEGLQAFWNGNYGGAAALFESSARRVEDQLLRSKALFGLACARLAAVENAEDLKAARAAWQEWEAASGGDACPADPRMVTPFLTKARLFAPPKEQREPKPQAAPAPRPSAGEQDMAKRLQEKEKEVQLLQKQIKALETIHREIQEKKKMTAQ